MQSIRITSRPSARIRKWRRSGVFIVNSEYISHLVVYIVNFEHVIARNVEMKFKLDFFTKTKIFRKTSKHLNFRKK